MIEKDKGGGEDGEGGERGESRGEGEAGIAIMGASGDSSKNVEKYNTREGHWHTAMSFPRCPCNEGLGDPNAGSAVRTQSSVIASVSND